MDTKFLITLSIALAAQLGGAVWWASNMSSQITHFQYQLDESRPDVAEAIRFTKEWPRGAWLGGAALPDDERQNMRLDYAEKGILNLEKEIEKLTNKLYGNGEH